MSSTPSSTDPYTTQHTMSATDEKSQQSRFFGPSYPSYTEVSPLQGGFISPPQARRAGRGRRLVVRTLHFVVLVSLLLYMFPGIVQNLAHLSREVRDKFRSKNMMYHEHIGTFEDVDDCVRFANWSVEEHGQYFASYPGQESHPFPYSAKTSVELPVSSDLLYLVSRGTLSTGVVAITAEGDADSDVAVVEVEFLYHHSEILDHAKVCLLQREESMDGVGIFTPEHWHHHPREYPRHHRSFFSVKVKLPAPVGLGRLQINGFETNMPMFVHSVADLQDLVDFRTFSLRAANHPILAKSVFAQRGDVETSNSPIYGNFSTSDSLILRTSNAPISANVTLINEVDGHATELTMRSSNGYIVSNLTLVANTEDHTGGSFNVSVRSSNSPIDVTYVDAPVDSVLDFDGRTSNSPAAATAHKTFEGDFSLRTSTWFPVVVKANDTVEDPAGKGRTRHVETSRVNRGVSEGTVRWLPAEEDRAWGTFKLTTSNSPIYFSL